MTKYEKITVEKVGKILLWAFILSPVILFLIGLTISLFAKGWAETMADLSELILSTNFLKTAIYFALVAVGFTAIVISSAVYHNYRWKKFYTSVPVKRLESYRLDLNEEGLDGYFNDIRIAIRYYIWKDEEIASIYLYKNPYQTTKNIKIASSKQFEFTNYPDALVWEINIKGKKRKKNLDFENLLNEFINFALQNNINLDRNTLANKEQAPGW